MDKEKYTLEFLINASNKIIYNCLTSPSGLSEWFADDVNIRNDIYTFKWDGSEEDARLLNKKKDEFNEVLEKILSPCPQWTLGSS